MLNVSIDRETGWLSLEHDSGFKTSIRPEEALRLGQIIMEVLGPHAPRLAQSTERLTVPDGGRPALVLPTGQRTSPLTSPVPRTEP